MATSEERNEYRRRSDAIDYVLNELSRGPTDPKPSSPKTDAARGAMVALEELLRKETWLADAMPVIESLATTQAAIEAARSENLEEVKSVMTAKFAADWKVFGELAFKGKRNPESYFVESVRETLDAAARLAKAASQDDVDDDH